MTRFFGWTVVRAAFVLALFGWGVGFYGPPVFLHAVQVRTGWPVAAVSAAVTLHFLVGAVVVANLPRLHRRFGVPAVTTGGSLLLALGVGGWAVAAEPWHLIAATLLSGAGWVTMGAAAVNAVLAPWFAARRPAALAMAYNGASLGGVVFSPLWVAAIAAWGFPAAAGVVGVVMVAVVAVLSARVFRLTPAAMGQHPDGGATPAAAALAEAAAPLPAGGIWRDARFATLTAAMALTLFAQIGLLAHLVSVLAPLLGAQEAGLLAGVATAVAIVGRTLVGWLLPAGADRRLAAAASLAVQIAGSLVLTVADGSLPLLVAGVALFGFGIGNATSLPPLVAQQEFRRADCLRAVALMVATAQAAYAFAPAAFGFLRGGAAGDAALFLAAAAVQALAVVVLLGGRAQRVRALA